MKTVFTILFLISGLTIFSQDGKVAGEYVLKTGSEENNLFEYNLSLNEDGTFTFHYHSIRQKTVPPETHKYGKGTWKEEYGVITFAADKQKDIDEKNTLDFNGSKARFVTKSPRDKTDKVVKTRIKFFESGIAWMQTIDLLKL